MVARGKESVADGGRTRMAGERINNPATKSGCSSVGRTPHLGCGGREFKSHHSDQPLQDTASVHVVALLSRYGAGHHSKLPVGI